MSQSTGEVAVYGAELRELAEPILEELGKTNAEKLRLLLNLFESRESVPIAEAHACLYPGKSSSSAESSLQKLRESIAEAGMTAKQRLALTPDAGKRATDRQIRFLTFSKDLRRISAKIQSDTADGPNNELPRAIATRLQKEVDLTETPKRPITIFVSYAHKDRTIAEDFVDRLNSHLSSARDFTFTMWNDRKIVIGKNWDEEIQNALRDCDVGIFLASPAAFGSTYIAEKELGEIFGEGSTKIGIPVALRAFDLTKTDMKGLEHKQIYFDPKKPDDAVSFQKTRDKETFVLTLFGHLCQRLMDEIDAPSSADTEPNISADKYDDTDLEIPLPDETDYEQPGRACRRNLSVSSHATEGATRGDDESIAIHDLMSWAAKQPYEVEPFLAVLGDYGIGKTTLLRMFARRLAEERITNPSLPLPIYIDLRHFSMPKEGPVPSLETLLSGFIEHAWNSSATTKENKVTPDLLIETARCQNAIVMFDGLDEKTSSMSRERAKEFLDRLWSITPDAALRFQFIKSRSANHVELEKLDKGRLIFSCRTHYFRDIADQNSTFFGSHREGIESFPALILSPWNEQQIRNYLNEKLNDDQRAVEAIKLIKSVHNLQDLAERPYLLKLISEQIGQLESAMLKGETVNAARPYRLITSEWLVRDDGKHQIDLSHKRMLMEQLSLDLHREGEKSWSTDRLECWLDQFLISNPEIEKNAVSKDPKILKEDLRSATFVVRPDSGLGDRFQFAHTSLQEYFLASALVESLLQNQIDRWDIDKTTTETTEFVGQIIMLGSDAEQRRILGHLSQLLEQMDYPRAAIRAFEYWLQAIGKELPVPDPKSVELAGVDFQDITIAPSATMHLPNVNFSRANLRQSRWKNVFFDGVDFSGADLTGADFELCDTRNAIWNDTAIDGVDWWRGNPGDLSSAKSSTGFALQISDNQHVINANGNPLLFHPTHPSKEANSNTFSRLAHTDMITACAFSSDDSTILTASYDKTAKVWDAETGNAIREFLISERSYAVVALHPNGTQLLNISPGGWRDFGWLPRE